MSDTPASKAVPGLREDLLHHDPLLGCLVEMTRLHGKPSTRAALTAGIPLEKGCLTPSLFPRSAARAGFACKIVRRLVERIDQALLPAILLLREDEACILLGWEGEGDAAVARLLFPEAGQGEIQMTREALQARYLGIAIFCRPRFSFDARAPEVGKVKLRHWFWGTLAEQWPVYRDVVAAALLINVFALVMPLFTMNVYDRVVPNNAVDTLWMMALGVLLIISMDFAVRLLRGHFIDLAGARIDVQLSSTIMERVLGMRMEGKPASVGSFASNLRAFESVRDFIASATVSALIDLPFAVIFILAIIWVAWPLALIPLVALVIGLLYGYVVQHKMHELSETSYRAAAMRNGALIESLTALETIKTQCAEGVVQKKWEGTTAFLARVNAQTRLLSASALNGASAIQQTVNVTLIIGGVYLIHAGELSMGGLIAVTMLGSRAITPLSQVVGLLMQYQNARTALESLEKMMNNPIERGEDEFIHRPELSGDVEFRDVTFAYPGQAEPALRNVSFRIRAGEKVVIIGRTGSGKTTLQKLMLGLYKPTEGAVRIDGIHQRQLDPADIRRNIGFVGQECILFYGTLRENISIGAPYADDSAIVHAAEVAGLTQFVNRHPQGFDMLIGERGESLSGGQRQEVAIARALLMDPPVLLLDEPTSAMDFSTEHEFKQRIRQYAAHKTMIIVTHRTSLIELADRIIVVDEGRIVADGPREQVIDALQSGKVGKG